MAFLEVRDLRAYYGSVQALKGISIEVEEGQIVALIGANGAGKSTTLRAISGLLHTEGSIRFAGQEIGRPPIAGSASGHCFPHLLQPLLEFTLYRLVDIEGGQGTAVAILFLRQPVEAGDSLAYVLEKTALSRLADRLDATDGVGAASILISVRRKRSLRRRHVAVPGQCQSAVFSFG